MEQAELAVVDQLVLLGLLEGLDGEAQLLLGLVHRLVEQVGDARVDLQHGLGDAELELAGGGLVVDEGAGQHRLAGVTGRDLAVGEDPEAHPTDENGLTVDLVVRSERGQPDDGVDSIHSARARAQASGSPDITSLPWDTQGVESVAGDGPDIPPICVHYGRRWSGR